jgi:hypothetical protein
MEIRQVLIKLLELRKSIDEDIEQIVVGIREGEIRQAKEINGGSRITLAEDGQVIEPEVK